MISETSDWTPRQHQEEAERLLMVAVNSKNHSSITAHSTLGLLHIEVAKIKAALRASIEEVEEVEEAETPIVESWVIHCDRCDDEIEFEDPDDDHLDSILDDTEWSSGDVLGYEQYEDLCPACVDELTSPPTLVLPGGIVKLPSWPHLKFVVRAINHGKVWATSNEQPADDRISPLEVVVSLTSVRLAE